VEELVNEILPYTPFFDASQGGVTISGGEPLLQSTFLCVLFKILQFQGIHTCLDTNGYVPPSAYDAALEKLMSHTDLVLLDIKHMDDQQHRRLTGVSNRNTLAFARYLEQINKPVWIRYVVVPGYTDDPADIRQLAEFIAPMKNVEQVELLPFHQLGAHKWQFFNDQNPLQGVPSPTSASLAGIQALLREYGIASIG
jgi:pyruvate formate lyase activating enzyme